MLTVLTGAILRVLLILRMKIVERICHDILGVYSLLLRTITNESI